MRKDTYGHKHVIPRTVIGDKYIEHHPHFIDRKTEMKVSHHHQHRALKRWSYWELQPRQFGSMSLAPNHRVCCMSQ